MQILDILIECLHTKSDSLVFASTHRVIFNILYHQR